MIYPNLSKEGPPTFSKPVIVIANEVPVRGAIEVLTAAKYLTEQQVRWWKGVVLPAMAKETGESKSVWENRLKLAVLPDDFKAEYIVVDNRPYATLPSITKLGKRKMNELIEGAVSQLHEWGFDWATLPNPDLRSLK